MQQKRASRARALRWVGVLGVIAAVMTGCAVDPPAPTVPPADYHFNSAAHGQVSLTIDGLADDPVVVNAGLPGRSVGSWDGGTGDLSTQLTFKDGTLPVEAPGLSVGVGYSLHQDADATGHFDPVTGQGSLNANLTLAVSSIDLGSGAVPVGQPCLVGLGLQMSGGIDLATKVLHVHQDGFTVTHVPAEEECDSLGGAIGALLGGPINSMDLSFSVAENELPAVVAFNSPSSGDMSVSVEGLAVSPLDITTNLVGTSTGSWDTTTGALNTALTFNDGTIGAEKPEGHLFVDYHLAQSADATGTFDPDTGEGTLTAGLVLTVKTFDWGTPVDLAPPCDVGIALTMHGAINLHTHVLDVSQTGFTTTGPASSDCESSGDIISTVFGFPTNAASLNFSVAGA